MSRRGLKRPDHHLPIREFVSSCLLFMVLQRMAIANPTAGSPAGPLEEQSPADPEPYRWSAGDFVNAGRSGLERVNIRGLRAVRLESARKTTIDLTAEYPWQDLSGPITLRVVFQPTRRPREKVPLLSKWHMRPAGRSFELGLMRDGRPFFDLSASGNWDARGRELIGVCRVEPGKLYALAAVFQPGERMALFLNGHACGSLRDRVPGRIFASKTPVLLGAQPPGHRWADVAIASVGLDRRPLTAQEIAAWAKSSGWTQPPEFVKSPVHDGRMDLSIVRRDVLEYCRSLQVGGRPFGVFRARDLPDAPATLYATCDVAWIRACMGESLSESLSPTQREQWIDHINSFARADGTYSGGRHSLEHANGMVIGALAVLGGRQKYPVTLYDAFDSASEIEPWLEGIRWERQWSASHLFWGGMHCYSMSRHATDAWRESVFSWLDDNLDPGTGWWRRGVPQEGRPIEVLGGAAHIWPIYQHHGRVFPYPRQVIDSILSMQREDGSWLGFSNYMELDALYGLAYMHSLAPSYRARDIAAAARRHGRLVQERYDGFLSAAPDAHIVLAVVGTLALLMELTPEPFHDEVRWSDIFSDRRFYRTDLVESPSGSLRN